MDLTGNTFYAKLMLFGEYSVIFDSMCLTVPYTHFSGRLAFTENDNPAAAKAHSGSNGQLKAYHSFLIDLKKDSPESVPLDLDGFGHDNDRGLYFDSDIPRSYGVGSSGALVAAIFDRYGYDVPKSQEEMSRAEIGALRSIFSAMESHFHGKSSGIDPLLCYIRRPLLIKGKSDISVISNPWNGLGTEHAVFLLDTGAKGHTGPLVREFLDRCNDAFFMSQVNEKYIPSTNGCIQALIGGEMDLFFEHLGNLSFFQYRYLPRMIPDPMKKHWSEGLSRDDFKLKLCGSGGGGYLICISKDYKNTMAYFNQSGLKLVPVYINH